MAQVILYFIWKCFQTCNLLGGDMSRCKLCDKILPSNKLSLLKHMAVDHEVVMTYVERDMALEAELGRAVDNMEVSNLNNK